MNTRNGFTFHAEDAADTAAFDAYWAALPAEEQLAIRVNARTQELVES